MEWPDIFKVMKGKDLKPSILYPARLSFRFDGEIKSFTEKKKKRENTAPSNLLYKKCLRNFWRQETQEKEKTYTK